ncbi:MAG: HD domain-containing protein [Candidatus Kapaibacteriales bacterium]
MFSTANLFKELFRGFTVLRWNDKLRPVEFIEIDKHAHKMMIAWCIGKYEESNGKVVDWLNIIRGGVYELLRRIVIRDIKNPIFFKIKNEFPAAYRKLNHWVYEQLASHIEDLTFKEEFRQFLIDETLIDPYSQKILDAAHKYSSYIEFLLIKQINPTGYQIDQIEKQMLKDLDKYLELDGVKKIITKQRISEFIDLCGQLRFQIRWSQTPRIPRTSVLGHSMFVACLTYFFARDLNSCSKRIYNDFFGGLFHDLPETVTRDIIHPVKTSSEDFQLIVKEIEQSLAEKEIYSLLEEEWRDEIRYFTQDEFSNKIILNNEVKNHISFDDLNSKYNYDVYCPFDGELIRAADQIAAFLEANSSIQYGIRSLELQNAVDMIKQRFNKHFGSIDLAQLYEALLQE